jgi:putative lipoprotein
MIARLPSCAILVTLALTIGGCATPRVSETVAAAAAVPLVNTDWRLTRLGERILDNPPGADAVRLQLQAQNPRITGFAGCNRLFGGYLLNGDQLKFAQVGATRMACLDESRMELERDFFQMLTQVSGWKIDGSSLQLVDPAGAPLATFSAGEPGAAH